MQDDQEEIVGTVEFQDSDMILFHVTEDETAALILAAGFRDAERCIGHDDEGNEVNLSGVWFSDRPLWDGGYVESLPDGWACLSIEMADDDVESYSVDNGPECPYREWCIPALLVNEASRLR